MIGDGHFRELQTRRRIGRGALKWEPCDPSSFSLQPRDPGRSGGPPDRRQLFHFTPTSASWLNAVEDLFAKLTRCGLYFGPAGRSQSVSKAECTRVTLETRDIVDVTFLSRGQRIQKCIVWEIVVITALAHPNEELGCAVL